MAQTAFERNLVSPITLPSFYQHNDGKLFLRLARIMTRRLHRFGCFPLIRGRGLTHWVDRAMGAGADFFGRPENQKRLSRAATPGGAGYAPLGSETLGENGDRIWRESFTINSIDKTIGQDTAYHSVSPVWPAEPPAFQVNFEQYQEVVGELSHEVLRAVAVSCGEKPSYFGNIMSNGAVVTRLFFYPDSAPNGSDMLAPAHDDVSLLTVAAGLSAPGLELLDADADCYVPVRLPRNQVLVMAGEQLGFITAGYLKTTTHRVRVSPPGGRAVIMSFVSGNKTTILPQMFSARANPYLKENADYADMNAQEFANARLGGKAYQPKRPARG